MKWIHRSSWKRKRKRKGGSLSEVDKSNFKERRDDFDVAIGVIYGVASSLSWSKSMCNPDTGIARIRGPLKTIASFQR
jgi:hypothetical protein